MPYKDKVFSLSVRKCAVHGEDYGCGKNSITSLKKQFFSLLRNAECLINGEKPDAIQKQTITLLKTSWKIQSH